MFSGIVKGVGKVLKVTTKKDCISIEILPPRNFNTRLKKGASISVDGVCLTSLDDGKTKLKFDVIDETLKIIWRIDSAKYFFSIDKKFTSRTLSSIYFKTT